MILKGRYDTNNYKVPGKYCDPMAIVLDTIWLDGDLGDESVIDDNGWFGAVRYGRRILSWNSQGFISSSRFDTVTEAESFMTELEADWHDDEEVLA